MCRGARCGQNRTSISCDTDADRGTIGSIDAAGQKIESMAPILRTQSSDGTEKYAVHSDLRKEVVALCFNNMTTLWNENKNARSADADVSPKTSGPGIFNAIGPRPVFRKARARIARAVFCFRRIPSVVSQLLRSIQGRVRLIEPSRLLAVL